MRSRALLASLIPSIYALNITIESSVVSCMWLVGPKPWTYQSDSGYYGTVCTYEPAFGSWVLCIQDNLNSMTSPILFEINRICSKFQPPVNESQILQSALNATKYLRNDSNDQINYPLKSNDSIRETASKAAKIYITNKTQSNSKALIQFYYLAGVFLIGTVWYYLPQLRNWCLNNPKISKLRSLLVIPPTIGELHATPNSSVFGGFVPTRLESLIIMGYLVVHILSLTLHYSIDNSEYLEPQRLQYLRFIGDRTGILSFAQLPLIFLFSGRNSFLEVLSGMKYTTSIVLHKYIARFMVLDAVCHSVCYLLRAQLTNTLEMSAKQPYWRSGMAAGHVSVLIIIFSIGIFRHKFYELFVVLHILLSMLFLYFCYQHVKPFGWTQWIYIAIAIWILEKASRFVKILLNGGVLTAKLELINDELVKITVPKPRRMNYQPGQYVFMYVLWPTSFFQSHPFTCVQFKNELIIVLKAKNGITKQIFDYAHQSTKINLLLEGPYGVPLPKPDKRPVLYICGGTGLPVPLTRMAINERNQWLVYIAPNSNVLNAYTEITNGIENMQVFLTREQTNSEFTNHRPDLQTLITQFCNKPVTICSCGPPQLVDEVRRIVANLLPTQSIEYIEEYQVW